MTNTKMTHTATKRATFLIGLLALLMQLPTFAQAPSFLTNGLVAYYPFNGSGRDYSGNRFHFTPVSLSTDRFGRPGHCIDSSMGLGLSLSDWGTNRLAANTPRTISIWLAIRDYPRIMSPDWGWKPNAPYVELSYGVMGPLRFFSDGEFNLDTGTSVVFWKLPNISSWRHLVVVCDSSLVGSKVYLDSALVQATRSGGAGGWPAGFPLFSVNGSTSNNVVDDVRIYNRALSEAEVAALYKFESSPYPDVPVPATATAQVVNGFVVGLSLTDGGWGYTNNPTVTFVGGGGSGASGTTTIDAYGSVAQITIVNPGGGYTSTPQVIIAAPPYPPEQAVASAQVVNGFLVGFTVTNSGRGYVQAPRIWLNGGGGTGASVSANIDTNGIITSIQIVNPGSGYTNAPQVVIEPPVFPLPSITLARGQQVAFTQLQTGNSYQLQNLAGGIWRDTGSTVVATNSTHSLSFGGSGAYRLVPLPLPRTATATPSVVNGFLVGINLTGGGAGYTSSPSVTIQDATGTGATTSVTVLTGAVTRVQIISPGSGYSANPTVTIAPPPVVAIAGSSSPAVTLNMLNLFPNIPYQLEKTSDLKTFVPVGGTFLPTATTNNVTVNAGTGVSFYRVVYRR